MSMRKKQEGGSIVEFAIMGPLFLVILFAIMEFSLALYNQAVITNASREGARLGIRYTNNLLTTSEVEDDMEARVNEVLTNTPLVTFGTGTATPTCTVAGLNPGDNVQCQVDFTYEYGVIGNLIQLIGGDLGSSIDQSSTTRMQME